MEGAKSARPREFKKKTFRSQEERRKAVLKRQQDARRNLTDHARMLALEELEASVLSPSVERVQQDELEAAGQEPVQMEAGSERRQKLSYWAKKRLRDFYARQLCIPEWMTEVPSDLNGSAAGQGQGWLVRCRPEGKRCLLISSKGRTISRLQHGEILHKFPSALPNGSSDSGFAQEYSILDAIFHEEDQTYYVLDVMCWKVRQDAMRNVCCALCSSVCDCCRAIRCTTAPPSSGSTGCEPSSTRWSARKHAQGTGFAFWYAA